MGSHQDTTSEVKLTVNCTRYQIIYSFNLLYEYLFILLQYLYETSCVCVFTYKSLTKYQHRVRYSCVTQSHRIAPTAVKLSVEGVTT